MKITTDEFISNFHSLTGTTVGERQKSLYLLLNKIRECEHTELDFNLLMPKTPLEEKLKVDALIYFKRIPEVLEVLKCENPILIEKIVKISSWLIQEAFQNVSGEELVNSIFPHISFNAKVKILNKLALNIKNPERGDEYFKRVEEKYGFYLASKLIPCCSLDLIMKCIKVNRLKIMPRHLLLVIMKQPAITESILKELKGTGKVDPASDYKIVFKYLARNDIVLFLKLKKEYNASLKVGWRITDKYVKNNKEAIIKSPENYYSTFHNKQIAKSMNRSFPEMYFNMFPTSINNFANQYDKLIGMCSNLPNRICNVELLLKTFERIYGSNLWDHTDYIDLTLLNMLSKKYREIIVKIERRPTSITEEKWYSYMTTEISIPYLKKTITLSSNIQTRAELISLLVETCKNNNDKKALAKLCTYMVTKHRNDHISVRLAFIKTLKKNFKLGDLEEEHWTPINELIEIFVLNEEQFYHEADFIEGYVYYRLKNNMDIKEELKKYMKANYNSNYNIIKKKPEYEKKCLLMFGELIPEVNKDSNLENSSLEFLRAVIDWNKRHPDDQISLLDYVEFIDKVKCNLKENGCGYQIEAIINFCILKLNAESEVRKEILKCYFTEKNTNLNLTIMMFLLKTEPLTIKESICDITRLLLKMYWAKSHKPFWSACKYYTHLEIPKNIINICKDSPDKDLEEQEQNTVISNAITALSYLMSNEEFINFIKSYYPAELTADSKSAEGKRMHTIQQNIGKCLRNVKPASATLESISVFCKGDYLKLVQSSLYSLCNNINENKLLSLFNELSGRAVSVRKHALHLTLRVLDTENVYTILKKFMVTEKNASMRKFIFKSIFNFFVQNASDYSWEILTLNMKAVDVNDKEAVEILMQSDKIPRQYFIKYLLFTWNVIENAPESQSNKEPWFSKLLSNIDSKNVNLLPKEFCQKIIDTYFLKNVTGLTHFQSQVNTFLCKYIIYCDSEEEQEVRLNANFEIVKNCASTKCEDLEQRAELWNYISDILKCFCMEYLVNNCTNIRVFKKFAELWKNSFPSHKAISEFLHLEFTLIYIEKLPISEIGKKLGEFCDALANMFGNIVVPIFSKKIIFFYNYFSPNNDCSEKLSLIENLLQPDPSTACLILTIMLLDNEDLNKEETKAQYGRIIEVLEKQTDPTIQIFFNNYIRGTTTLDYR